MKKLLSLTALLLLALACNQRLEPVEETPVKTAGDFVFQASFEKQTAPETKVFMNEDWQLRWNTGDRISVFNKTSDNLAFAYNGADAALSGTFSALEPDAVLSGAPRPKIYAVYPYASGTTVAADGTFSLTLPAEQSYYGGVSFGQGANTMVSVSEQETNQLVFRNVCGYLQIKLYGEGASVSRVTLKSNAGEPLAGSARVSVTDDGVPSVTMQADAAGEVSMTCPTPVPLGTDAAHYTTFLLAIPPTTFTQGFTLTVTDSDGYIIEKSTTKAYTVERNTVFAMAPLCCREIETFAIENAGIRNYIAQVDYSSDPSYSLSYVDQYKSTASDDPLPFKVSSVSGAAKVRMKALTAPYWGKEWTVSGTSVYNLIPGVVYHYDVLSNAGASLKSGFVRPEGQVRMISGFSYNVRDLGGWAASGGSIVYGRLYRGAQLEGIKEEGKTIFLDDLQIAADLDLRGYDSGSPARVLDASRCEYENIKLWKFLGNGTGTTQELYQKAIRDIIGWLSAGKNVYFHCIGGADRTGTLAFLIEALLGVSESDLSKDYELTSFDGSHSRKRNDKQTNYQQTNSQYIFTWLINYLRSDAFGGSSVSINQNVENWAKTRFSSDVDPLTDEEITRLRSLLITAPSVGTY